MTDVVFESGSRVRTEAREGLPSHTKQTDTHIFKAAGLSYLTDTTGISGREHDPLSPLLS